MPRFIYRAHGLALAGHLRRPVLRQLEPVAACVLPSVGGQAVSQAGAFQLQDPATGALLLAFESAETRVEGSESAAGVYRTQVRAVVRGLRILDMLRAEEVSAALTITYRRADRNLSVDAADSRLTGLTLAGRAYRIALDHALSSEASDYAAFRQRHPDLPESRGVTRYSLARHPELSFEPWEAGRLDRTGFGRIYFCEWSASHHTQSLTMLRLRLGSQAEGELEVGTVEVNGNDFP